MGIVAFHLLNRKLTLLHNRDNWHSRVIRPAAWDETNQILGGWCEENGGTWLGCSRQGRVASLVDTEPFNKVSGSELVPVAFLKGTMTPHDFVNEVAEEEGYIGLTFNLIVADINLDSMVYISKQMDDESDVEFEDVDPGVHVLSFEGLDSVYLKDLRMTDFFTEMIDDYENKELPPLKEIAERFMYDPRETEEEDKLSAFFFDIINEEGRYGTTSTTALVVKPTKEVMFYERYLDQNGEWNDHNFTFHIY